MTALTTNPSIIEGEQLLLQGHHEEALSVFEALLRAHPNSVDVLINLGVAALQAGDVQRGIDAHLQALRIDPTNASLLENLSILVDEPAVAAQAGEFITETLGSESADAGSEEAASVMRSILHSKTNGETVPAAGDGMPGPHFETPREGTSGPSGSTMPMTKAEESAAHPTPATRHWDNGSPSSPRTTAIDAAVPAKRHPQYRVDKKLKVVFKGDETARDYVALPAYLRRDDVSISREDLVDYLQFTFQKMIGTFFNTSKLPEAYVQTTGCILERMMSEHGISTHVSAKTQAEFVCEIYRILGEHLPTARNRREISIRPDHETLGRVEATDDVRDLYRALKTSFRPLEEGNLLSLMVVHGSLSTLDFTPFSDVDTQLFLTDHAFSSPEAVTEVAKSITKANVHLKSYDRLQEHGYFVATDLDRRSYPEPFLPIETLRRSTRLHGDEVQTFFVNQLRYADRFAAWHMGHFFRLSYVLKRLPQTPYDMKRFLSRFSLLPVLYLELVENVYPYKGDVFKNWQNYFTPEQWAPFHEVTSVRSDWDPDRSVHFSASFHQQVFEFAELLLDRLNDQAHQRCRHHATAADET